MREYDLLHINVAQGGSFVRDIRIVKLSPTVKKTDPSRNILATEMCCTTGVESIPFLNERRNLIR